MFKKSPHRGMFRKLSCRSSENVSHLAPGIHAVQVGYVDRWVLGVRALVVTASHVDDGVTRLFTRTGVGCHVGRTGGQLDQLGGFLIRGTRARPSTTAPGALGFLPSHPVDPTQTQVCSFQWPTNDYCICSCRLLGTRDGH